MDFEVRGLTQKELDEITKLSRESELYRKRVDFAIKVSQAVAQAIMADDSIVIV